MKKLILINGTMGAGKTTVSIELQKLLTPCVFLDGDWCWSMNPFTVNDETKRMVLNNISFMLNSFIGCSEYEYIIFCWVMHRQDIIDSILGRLDLCGVETHIFTLTLAEAALTKRLREDISLGIRKPDVLERSIARIGMYDEMDTIKIDVSDITPAKAAGKIISYL